MCCDPVCSRYVCVGLLQEHKTCVGMSEVEGRYKYTHMARSLKTYGITFFLVKVIGFALFLTLETSFDADFLKTLL